MLTNTDRVLVKNVKIEIEQFKLEHLTFQPRLAIVQLDEKEDSNVYVSMKKKVAGPYGNSSIITDRIVLKLAVVELGMDSRNLGYVITEADFSADIGLKKFFNIKCRVSNLVPNAVVLVATVKTLKIHGGGPDVVPGKPLPEVYLNENIPMLETNCAHLTKHIQNAKKFGVPVVMVINKFTSDTDAEMALI